MKRTMRAGVLFAGSVASAAVMASSHREAPFITSLPKVDASDFYMFRSYEAGHSGYVTLIANYLPLQDAHGGPNFFQLDPKALYEIHIDNNGDANEDLTFQFRFQTARQGLAVMAGNKSIPVPLANIGPISPGNSSAQNVAESYTLKLVRGDRRRGSVSVIADASSGDTSFGKPLDNIGGKSIPNYATYANSFIHTVSIPGCNAPARVFVGQRKEGFVVNLGEIFDLVNIKYPVDELAPGGNASGLEPNTLVDKNVTSLALEIPISCLVAGNDPVIGAWTTASVRQSAVINPEPQNSKSVASVGPISQPTGADVRGGAWVQVSRLGAPLVNEVIIGLPDKDRFNASFPKNDAQFADYVTNPSLPVLLQTLFGSAGVKAPNVYPRTDLMAAFLTGVAGLNKPANGKAAEMLRLNTSIAPVAIGSQKDLGVLAGDTAGFPNGRRPYDDVVDIELRVAMGALLSPFDGSAQDPDAASSASRQLHYTDGALPDAAEYLQVFPYLNTPITGSPNGVSD